MEKLAKMRPSKRATFNDRRPGRREGTLGEFQGPFLQTRSVILEVWDVSHQDAVSSVKAGVGNLNTRTEHDWMKRWLTQKNRCSG